MVEQTQSVSSKMEIDYPSSLKRSSSAPMIPQLNNSTRTGPVQFTSRPSSRNSNPCPNPEPNRVRRFSASYSPRRNTNSPKTMARIEQIRQEECFDALDREMAHENKLHDAMRISQSWDDLTIMVDSLHKSDDECKKNTKCKDSAWDPLNFHLSNFNIVSCSPSPTRCNNFTKQYPSPGLFKFNLSPSPTRKTFTMRRSLSPIALRPSSLGPVKRKFDLSENEPPAKRSGGLLLVQSRLDRGISPQPGSSVSSVGTPESLSNSDSPSNFSLTTPDSPSCDHPMQDVSKVD